MNRFRFFLSEIAVIATIAYPVFFAHATAPQLLITWSAENYAPSWYQGKVLPGLSSTVRVSAQLLDNGKIADMSKYPVQWHLNDHALAAGSGIASAFFTTADQFSTEYIVEARIKKYQNGPDITGSITVPRVQPILVMSAPYPDKVLPRATIRLQAIPFFFSISKTTDLNFSWKINEITSNGEIRSPDFLSFTTIGNNPDATVAAKISAINSKKPAEAAEDSAIFSLQ